jgi:hypothetical protein
VFQIQPGASKFKPPSHSRQSGRSSRPPGN